jgi:hypothetical protein
VYVFVEGDRGTDRGQEKAQVKEQVKAELKAQYKAVLRITGLMLCCAVLFLSGFYLGIYQGSPTYVPGGEIITGTYTPPNGQDLRQAGEGREAPAEPDSAAVTATTPNAGTSTDDPTAQEELPAPPTPEELLTSLKWPVDGKISKDVGWIYSEYLSRWVYLSGVEISCDANAQVLAVLPGSVETVTVDPMLGTVVTIKHDGGLKTTYGHVSAVSKGPGATVAQGDTIGTGGMGSVYFSVSRDDEPLSARECLAQAR